MDNKKKRKELKEERIRRSRMSLRQKIKAAESEISSKEFFLSKGVQMYIQRLITNLLIKEKKDNISLYIDWDERKNVVAYTNNIILEVNASHELFSGDKETRFKKVIGAATHEMSHYLYTNFTESMKAYRAINAGCLYPCDPSFYEDYEDEVELNQNLSEIKDFLDGKIGFVKSTKPDFTNREWLSRIYQSLSNILEDGRIEYLFGELHGDEKVLFEGLCEITKAQYDSAPTIDELLEKVESKELFEFEALESILLHYIRFGGIKGYTKEHKKVHIVEAFNRVENYLDDYKESLSSFESYTFCNKVIIGLWPELKEFIEAINEKIETEGGSFDGIPQMMDDRSVVIPMNGGTPDHSGMSGEGTDSDSFKKANPSMKGKESTKTPKTASEDESKSDSSDDSDNESESEPKDGSEDGSEDSSEDDSKDKSKDGENSEDKSSEESNEETNIESSTPEESERGKECREQPRIGKVAETISKHFNDGENNEMEIEEESSNAKVDFNKLLDDYAKTIVENEEENIVENEHKALNSTIEYNDIHEGVGITFIRHKVTKRNTDDYKEIEQDVNKLVKEMLRKSDFLQDEDDEITFKNKLCGSKFNVGKVAKGDYKYYDKTVHVNDKYGLDVIILCDESGSMGGQRIEACKAAAITIYQFMKQAVGNDHVSVYGHSTDYFRGGNHVKMVCYADFDNPDEDDVYRMMNMSAGGANRDGMALKFVEEKIAERDAERKIIITISDGQPADCGYGGEEARKDIQSVLRTAEKNNIMYIAAAIGSDLETIKEIYGEKHFLDLTNLEMLPHKLTTLIARLIR